jgi:hypothetical protein
MALRTRRGKLRACNIPGGGRPMQVRGVNATVGTLLAASLLCPTACRRDPSPGAPDVRDAGLAAKSERRDPGDSSDPSTLADAWVAAVGSSKPVLSEERRQEAPNNDCDTTASLAVHNLPEVRRIIESATKSSSLPGGQHFGGVGPITSGPGNFTWSLGLHTDQRYVPLISWSVDPSGRLEVEMYGREIPIPPEAFRKVARACKQPGAEEATVPERASSAAPSAAPCPASTIGTDASSPTCSGDAGHPCGCDFDTQACIRGKCHVCAAGTLPHFTECARRCLHDTDCQAGQICVFLAGNEFACQRPIVPKGKHCGAGEILLPSDGDCWKTCTSDADCGEDRCCVQDPNAPVPICMGRCP